MLTCSSHGLRLLDYHWRKVTLTVFPLPLEPVEVFVRIPLLVLAFPSVSLRCAIGLVDCYGPLPSFACDLVRWFE
jgi:heme/copper-type cytochrome/quinol oxidase subunit 1